MNKAPGEETLFSKKGYKDSRTLLPDRDSFYADINPLLVDADLKVESLVLLDIDIEGLDFVLRMFGPVERDNVIREVGQRIQNSIQSDVTVYHINQDRFALVLHNSNYAEAAQKAEALIESIKFSFDVNGVSYNLKAYVGISHYPNHCDNLVELVRASVFACYQARQSETCYASFDQQVDEQERYRFRLLIDLQKALESQKGIELAYQPQVNMKTGACVGVEGLCRWNHVQHGLIPPGHFLPFVEQTPLMMPLTEATLCRGLQDLSDWKQKGFAGSVAINLSPTLFRYSGLLDCLLEHCRFLNTDMEQVHFEVTETGIMNEPKQAIDILTEIRNQGSQVAVDDFGTGHSSLAYIADLPADIIKIDQHFIQNLSEPWGKAIVGAATTLAQQLGLMTIAEGIEDEYQYQQCRDLGIDIGQGFYMARPMFKKDFEQWLELK